MVTWRHAVYYSERPRDHERKLGSDRGPHACEAYLRLAPMTRIPQSEFDQFTNLVNENGRKTEVECGSFLHFAAALLIRQTTITEFFVREDRNYFGSTDFIISAKIQ